MTTGDLTRPIVGIEEEAAPVSPPAESGEVERLRKALETIKAASVDGWFAKIAEEALANTPAPHPAAHRRVQDAALARPELDALIAEAKAQAPQPGGAPGYKIGAANRAAVRALMASHLGITRVEISKRLGLGVMAVTRHVAKIRAEWGGQKLPTRRRLPLPTPPAGEG